MLHFPRWKIYLIFIVCAFGVAHALPNLLSDEQKRHIPSFLPQEAINLGLDLRGGSHLLLEIDLSHLTEDHLNQLSEAIRMEFRKQKLPLARLAVNQQELILTSSATNDQVRQIIRKIDPGLDISQQNDSWNIRYRSDELARQREAAINQSVEIVRRRIDETGTKEPSIQRQGENQILVQLPGVDDPAHIKSILGQTAKLSFSLVDGIEQGAGGFVKPGYRLLPSADEESNRNISYIVSDRVIVSGENLADAQATFHDGEAVVSFRFDALGGRRFGDATKENVGRPFAIILDNKVISAPVIKEPILGGQGIISGRFTAESARDLALLLRAGALPAPLQVVEEKTVGPGLGSDSIKGGKLSSIVALALVLSFMIIVYRLFGFFANIALLMNLCLLIAALTFLQATLTLPGIAGIVLTMGMAVDANVLIYQRIKEELRKGRSVISSVDTGFSQAFITIFDSNLTTLISAALLFVFGSGPIRGFAVTLCLGLLTSLFTSVTFSRLLIITWLRYKKPKSLFGIHN